MKNKQSNKKQSKIKHQQQHEITPPPKKTTNPNDLHKITYLISLFELLTRKIEYENKQAKFSKSISFGLSQMIPGYRWFFSLF